MSVPLLGPAGSIDGNTRQEPPLLLVGTDYRCAPIELREKVSFSKEETEEILIHLLARTEVAEAFLLSTCNRTEVYLQPRDEEGAYNAILSTVFLHRVPELERPGRLYVKRNGEAARHLLGVASGLESMVLGEPEILGQVKQASVVAEAVGAEGPVLRRLLRCATSAGKRARQETAITSGAVSLGYAVVELARNIFRGLEECQVLLIGAGEIARSVARPVMERGARELKVANRSLERAQQLKAEFPQAEILTFEERLPALSTADLVIVTTGADEPVLTRAHIKAAMKQRPSRPLLVVDLGVPRNVEPRAGGLENVFLHAIDSLDTLIQRNLKRRKEEVPKVEEIIEQELAHFRAWVRALEAEPLIARLQKQAEKIRRLELEAALARFPQETHEELERLTRSLVRKILHHPSSRLRASDGSAGGLGDLSRLDMVRELFHLDDDETSDERD